MNGPQLRLAVTFVALISDLNSDRNWLVLRSTYLFRFYFVGMLSQLKTNAGSGLSADCVCASRVSWQFPKFAAHSWYVLWLAIMVRLLVSGNGL